MKKTINEIAKFQRLAGLITESEYQETIMNEAKEPDLIIPANDAYDLDEEAEHFSDILDNAGIMAKCEAGIGEIEIYLTNKSELKKAKQAIEDEGYQVGYNETKDKDEDDKEKVEEAKIPVSKDKKIQVLKEWIWYTCDEGQAKDDINKYNKMIDIYFADKDDVTKEDFKKIWAKVTEKYGVGDVGADWDAFPETWNDIQRGRLVNPFMKYEGKEKVEEDNDFRGTDSKFVKRDDGCYRINDKGEESKVHHTYCRKDVNEEKVEEISGGAFRAMDNLVSRNHVLSLLAAAEGIMGDLSAEGFEVEDIRDYINQIIVNDI